MTVLPPVPAGWVQGPGRPGQVPALVVDPLDPLSPRLTAHLEHAGSLSLSRWRDSVVEGLGRTLEDWLLVDVGPSRVAGARGFHVVGCSTPAGRPARIHQSWCTVRHGNRCTVSLTCPVAAYDDLVDAVTAAVRDWSPTVGEVH